MKPITEREEFESNCVYVIWYHDYYNLEDHIQKCVCLTDREYRQQHSAIVEMYSECGRIETHIYVKESEIRTRPYQSFASDTPYRKGESNDEDGTI